MYFPPTSRSGTINPVVAGERAAQEISALESQIIAKSSIVTDEKNNLDRQIAYKTRLENDLSNLNTANNPYAPNSSEHQNWENDKRFKINDVQTQLKYVPTAIDLARTSHYNRSQELENLLVKLRQLKN